MLPISDGKRDVYGLDTLQVMGAAFDTAVQLLPPNLKDHERTRRKLALLILHHTDRGEPAGVLAIIPVLTISDRRLPNHGERWT